MSRINTNIPSLRAIDQLNKNNAALNTSLQRLSSGLRINTGADDPAGLIASESLRSEMVGLQGAIDNSSRAINVISTADSSLGEVSDLLIQIRGLITKSANSGALSDTELKANQDQVNSLLEAVNSIANTTQFNGKKLLNGELGYTVANQDTTQLQRIQIFGARVPDGQVLSVNVQVYQSAQTAKIGIAFGGNTGLSSTGNLSAANNTTLVVRGTLGTETFSFNGGQNVSAIIANVNAFTSVTGVSATTSATGLSFNSTGYGSSQFVSVEATSGAFAVAPGDKSDHEDAGRDAGVRVNGQTATADGLVASIRANGLDVVLDLSKTFGTAVGTSQFKITGGGAQFQVGPQVNSDGLISIGIPSVNTTNLGDSQYGFLNTIAEGGANSLVGGHYTAADQIVSSAIEQVSVLSGRIGGFQANQLQTNIDSRSVAYENVKAAESAIRDTDYASEVAALTRAQVLVQSTTQILGIANQLPNTALALLR